MSLFNRDQNQATSLMKFQLKSAEPQKQSFPKGVANNLEVAATAYRHGKVSESQSQEHDSSSSLSTCQSHHAGSRMSSNKSCTQNIVSELGHNEVYGRTSDSCLRSCSPCENTDYEMHQAQLVFSGSMACISSPWTESYYGGLIASYTPNALIYPQMAGMTPGRVALPLERAESFPIYVNAKQYRAILRRRKIRAKLEVQNKHAVSRKPYLHESRHLHAIRRARGSGGRFLRMKTTQQQSRPSSPATYAGYQSHQQELSETKSHSDQFQQSESSSWETSTPSVSDVTTIFSGDDVFQRPEFNTVVHGSPFHIGATMSIERGFIHGRT